MGLAKAYRDRLGLRSLYAADLDAILDGVINRALYTELSDLGLELWIDAGLRDARDVEEIGQGTRTSLLAGLETVRGPAAVLGLLDRVGPSRLIFSMDLNGGQPLVPADAGWNAAEPLAIARTLIDLGVRRFILLDLARVGTGQGPGTERLLHDLRAIDSLADPLEITVGGGIAGIEGVVAARAAGASSVLLGSTLHDGRITREMLDRLTSSA